MSGNALLWSGKVKRDAMKNIIQSEKAPAPIGPYSQAVQAGPFLYVSGQIAIDPATGQLVTINVIRETNQVLENIGAILRAAGMGYEHIVKTSIFLKDMNDFATVNEVYGEYFKGDFPARETVQVARLPKDVNVEISVIAYRH
jgi:2-iminobutanoate/2-iminopropanoate deaminase